MARHNVTVGRRPVGRSVLRRRVDARNALVASGAAPLLPTYELTQGSLAHQYFTSGAMSRGLSDHGHALWPTDAVDLDHASSVFRDDGQAVYLLRDDLMMHVSLGHGFVSVSVAAADRASIDATFAALRDKYPPCYLVVDDSDATPTVPITFWSCGSYGPEPRNRRIESTEWQPIRGNYTAAVQKELDDVMGWTGGPGRDGQLMLWQGPPGTGKTWALRALASEWAPWAEFNYITDPDAFFVDRPSYMIDVLLAESYAMLDIDGGVVEGEAPESKWRVLILEDTGELLSANAKEKYGQGLSRLLNVVDGMIGQGLKVIALVTTNDELEDLNPATTRPGRCASQVVFGALSDEEAQAWLGDPAASGGTLAELYAAKGAAGRDAFDADDDPGHPMGEAGLEWANYREAAGGDDCGGCASFEGGRCSMFEAAVDSDYVCDEWAPSGAVTAAAAPTVEQRIAAVAAQHAPDGGYGETAWDADTGTVCWVAADWTTAEQAAAAEDAFLAVDGVLHFEYEYEARPQCWCSCKVLFAGSVDVQGDAADPGRYYDCAEDGVAAAVRLARQSLDVPEADQAFDALVASLRSQGVDADEVDDRSVRAALEAISASHRATVESVTALVASGAQNRDVGRGDRLALMTLGMLREVALRPLPQPASTHVHVPEQPVHVTVEGATVNVPAQQPPVVNVAAPAAPQVVLPPIHVPASELHIYEGEQHHHVEVKMPEQKPPQVTVVQAAAAAPAPTPTPPRAVRVEYDDRNRKVFVPVDLDEEESLK